MEKLLKVTMLVLLVITASVMSSCQEETIQPTNLNKDGNITGVDDWEKAVV